MKILRSLPLCALASALLGTAAMAQSAAPTVRIVSPIDESQLVTLKGNVNPHANAQNDRGAVSGSLALPDLTLVLSRSPEQQAAFDAYVQSEYDSGSPNFHKWLTPAQIGTEYGPAQADIATISNWLRNQGFAVKSVSPDGMTIKFAGTAGTVQSAFHTSIHNLSVHGESHYANMTNPQVPAALASVVVGIKRLHNFLPKPMHKMGSLVQFNADKGKWQRIVNPGSGLAGTASSLTTSTTPSLSGLAALPKASFKALPQFGINGNEDGAYLEEDVTPWDFAAIYDVTPAWNAGYTGSGQTIAIAGTSEICLGQGGTVCGSENDVATYRSEFGLPAGPTPTQTDTLLGPAATVCTGETAPCSSGDQMENTLDTELSGAVATGAQIKLFVTGQVETGANAGSVDSTYDSASYIVENHPTVGANILSLSYGECELFQGTAENVAYYDLWQSAAAEGISVFVATGDSGSPACDQGYDSEYGNPYSAQYGLSVNGIASTPFNTAVGGTDFSWCQSYFTASGSNLVLNGCASSSTSQGSPAYWSTSNSSTTGASALGYVPEVPWNDTCENPIVARFLETLFSAGGANSALGINPTTPEETCSVLYNDWAELDQGFQTTDLEDFVDTVGGGGGVSGCIVSNTTDTTLGTCTSGATSTGSTSNPDTGVSQAALPLANNGWLAPTWQVNSGVQGTSGLTNRALPDVSFFAGNGRLSSATLICVQSQGSCNLSSTIENTAQEIGGTSVAAPEMAGVMALIDQKAGAAQGLANPELYKLAAAQTYSGCSAETVTNSSSCYFQDIDNNLKAPSGPAYPTANPQTISMPCALSAGTIEGGDEGGYGNALAASPNCYATNSGDAIGTLGTSSTTAGYNSATGFDMATGLGSLNVYNVVKNWSSDAGTTASSVGVVLSPTGTISDGTALTIAVTVTGTGTIPPTGTVGVAGGGYTGSGTLATSGTDTSTATITVPAGSLTVGSDTLTIAYNGDGTYASSTTTDTVTVSAALPIVTVTFPGIQSPASQNVANAVLVTVAVTGPAGTPASGTVTLAQTGGTYSSAAQTLTSSSGGIANFSIPAGALTAGNDTLTATYGGNASYTTGTGTAAIDIVSTPTSTATVKVTPTPTTVDTGQVLVVNVAVTGGGATPTGAVLLTLSAGTYTPPATALVSGAVSFTVPAGTFTAAGTPTITATYSGDANYAAGTGTATETVALSTYALAASTPAAVAPGSTTTSIISGSKSATNYTGTVTLNTCTLTSSSVTSPNSPPTCNVSGIITYAAGVASGSGTATVATTAASSAKLARPKLGNHWLGGGGAVLAFLVFLGIPARRKSWRAMLGIVVVTFAVGFLSSCGGGNASSGGSGGTSVSATSAGTYTFTVSGTGDDPAKTAESTTFQVTVN